MSIGIRALVYLCLGITAEIFFTGIKALLRKEYCMPAHTTLWMFPIYGVLLPIGFEPLHIYIQHAHTIVRGIVYAVVILFVEYIAATVYIWICKKNPWEYVRGWHIHGKIRLDYFPLWFVFGLLVEATHTFLLRIHL